MKIRTWHLTAMSLILGGTLTMYYIFMRAFVNGFQTTVQINVFNEAYPELILVHIMVVAGVIAFFDMGFKFKKEINGVFEYDKAQCQYCGHFYDFIKNDYMETYVRCPICGIGGVIDGEER